MFDDPNFRNRQQDAINNYHAQEQQHRIAEDVSPVVSPLVWLVVIFIVMAKCSSDSPSSSSPQAKSKTYLYRRPNINGKTKMYIIKGDKVKILCSSKNGQWYFIRYKKKNGGHLDMWVMKQKIKK